MYQAGSDLFMISVADSSEKFKATHADFEESLKVVWND